MDVVWVNGAFGAGKTTVTAALLPLLPGALLVDPEDVGLVLTRWVPPAPSGDFQDLPVWRRLVAETLVALREEYAEPLVVPMTLVDPVLRADVFDRLAAAGVAVLHVWLDVPADELRRRVTQQVLIEHDPAADAHARRFRLAAVDRCTAAATDLPSGTVVLDGRRPTAELAVELADRLRA